MDRYVGSLGCFRKRRRRFFRTFVIAVNTPPGLSAKPPGGGELLLHQGRRETRASIIGVENRLRGGRIDVMPNKIAEFERSHPKAGEISKQKIDRRSVCDAFFKRPPAFAVKRPRNAIDDEAGDIAHLHCDFAPSLHQRQRLIRQRRFRRGA